MARVGGAAASQGTAGKTALRLPVAGIDAGGKPSLESSNCDGIARPLLARLRFFSNSTRAAPGEQGPGEEDKERIDFNLAQRGHFYRVQNGVISKGA
jgi:hypothetical protein